MFIGSEDDCAYCEHNVLSIDIRPVTPEGSDGPVGFALSARTVDGQIWLTRARGEAITREILQLFLEHKEGNVNFAILAEKAELGETEGHA